MTASSTMRWTIALLSVALLAPTSPAAAAPGDALIICNKNQTYDVALAIATKAVPRGIAALMASGWRREGWWTIPAGRCENTMTLRDVQNYEIWLHVLVAGGTQIYFSGAGGQDANVCLHPTKAFDEFSWNPQDMQACRAEERRERFSYMGSVYVEDDAYSIYNHENRTLDLEFTYP
ncbi:DUF1036 domain-containing protein [Luteimonas sp. MC1828]|uniref:DUF1036 domain-containing protein n=1 Tax=Luteimonas sp. MC1828 TaxID=2799787 RepID=UPI0018F1D108|nr:DUF1036 domain-containing protein [Luteimonas sp. MC1828]MBJ7573842.1 DUF1036 domain-containing protein [Luteimonas sp. MC1828]